MTLAAGYGHAEIVEYLLNEGFDVNSRDEGNRTALHYAVLGNQVETSRLLISKGAKVDAIGEILDQNRSAPLHLAVRLGDYEVSGKKNYKASVTSSHMVVTFQHYILVIYQQLVSCLFLYMQKDKILFSFYLVFLYVQKQKTDQMLICNQYVKLKPHQPYVTK